MLIAQCKAKRDFPLSRVAFNRGGSIVLPPSGHSAVRDENAK